MCWFRRCWFRRCWFRRCWFRRCWFHRCWFHRHGCWYRRCFVFRRWFRCWFVFMRWYRWCHVNRIAFAIFWIALLSFAFARCKSPDFTRAGHRIVKPTLLLSFFLQHRRHTSAYVYQTVQSTVFPHYNEVYKKSE